MTKAMTIDLFIGLDPASPSATGDFENFFAKPFQKARTLVLSLKQHRGNVAVLRASGVVARVALERHLFCGIEARSLPLIVNPPSKKKPEVQDALNTLVKANVITAVQRSHFDSHLKVANNCAHPKEAVSEADVTRLVRDGRTAAAAVL